MRSGVMEGMVVVNLLSELTPAFSIKSRCCGERRKALSDVDKAHRFMGEPMSENASRFGGDFGVSCPPGDVE
jgi:hypothetical protein